MQAIWEFLLANKVVILSALLALSEVLALVPSFKSSGILDWVIRTIKKLLGKE
jgi:hypothetical protein